MNKDAQFVRFLMHTDDGAAVNQSRAGLMNTVSTFGISWPDVPILTSITSGCGGLIALWLLYVRIGSIHWIFSLLALFISSPVLLGFSSIRISQNMCALVQRSVFHLVWAGSHAYVLIFTSIMGWVDTALWLLFTGSIHWIFLLLALFNSSPVSFRL